MADGMADEQTPAQAATQAAPTIIGLSAQEAQHIAAAQHHAGWLAQEEARLLHELAYVRGAAQQARSEFHALLARAYGVDAAHDPLTIDLQARTITVQHPAAPTQSTQAAQAAQAAQPQAAEGE